jgi:CRISPR-associated protein Cmr5
MAKTLDQQRAAFAWECVIHRREKLKDEHWKKYRALAKGAPSLIMTSGLMPTVSFFQAKGKENDPAAWCLLDDIIRGLFSRLIGTQLEADKGRLRFGALMNTLQEYPSADYLRATDETLEILKWLRQFVDAV